MPVHSTFFGPWVVRATFVMAMFGWGVGFYGPSIFLHAVVQRTGWSLAWVSAAVTMHYLFGALVVALLPGAHRRFGVGPTAVVGASGTAFGVLGWSLADAPWQLFASALLSGAGWVTMGAVAVNAAISPWYERGRPMALAKAYNGASIGGVVFSPLWVLLIASWGFTIAATIVGAVTIAVMALLARAVYARTPGQLGQCTDGEPPAKTALGGVAAPEARALGGRLLWRDRAFVSLALGMAAGLFAQIGLLAHLFSLLVPALGAQAAGLAMGFATACAIGGRLIVAKILPAGVNRRAVAALAYVVQLAGSVLLLWATEQQTALILLGVALFGAGIGNATSLPPLIAQVEFAKEDVPRVVALIVAFGQATYAFAPATFGLVLSATAGAGAQIGSGTFHFFLAVAAVQGIAILCFLAGRRRARG
ncbi:MAG: MFS transporter [Rubrivivax sp.]|nr:MFS transporter [Rubrivivax sp.]